jgi:hypothetical protein
MVIKVRFGELAEILGILTSSTTASSKNQLYGTWPTSPNTTNTERFHPEPQRIPSSDSLISLISRRVRNPTWRIVAPKISRIVQ